MKNAYRSRIFLALFALAAIGGILLAQWISTQRLKNVSTSTTNVRQTIISEIILAALTDPSRRAEKAPPLRQSNTYTTDNLLALRITTEPSITSPIQLGARLLTEKGLIVELDPPSFTLPPGVSTFCCWQVAQAGVYTLQLFRPEGIITSIPLTIIKTNTQQQPTRNFL